MSLNLLHYILVLGIKLDSPIVMMMFGDITEDPLRMGELKEFAGEAPHLGVDGELGWAM